MGRWVVLAAGLLAACGRPRPAGLGSFDPPLPNLSPARYLRFHGWADPALGLTFKLAWQAASPSCRVVTNRLAGSSWPAWTEAPLAVSTDASGGYSADVPIDGVLPGACDWRFE